MADIQKEYWDTCLFLSFLNNRDDEKDKVEIISALLQGAKEKKRLIVVSTQVIAEIRPRDVYNQYHWNTVHDLFYTNRPFIKVVAHTPPIAVLAASIGAEHDSAVEDYRVTVPDAIHVATALVEQVDVMLTYDGDASKERRRGGGLLSFDGAFEHRGHTLTIKEPTMPLDSQLAIT